jgi:hypothetical protein
MPSKNVCSCGCDDSHVIAKRLTADGKIVWFWSDGMVTFALGLAVKGAGVAKMACQVRFNVAACWLLAEEIHCYDGAEVSMAVRAARKAVRSTNSGMVPALPIFHHLMERSKFSCKGEEPRKGEGR